MKRDNEINVGRLPYRKLPCMYIEEKDYGIRVLARFVDEDAMNEFIRRVNGADK